MTLDIYNDKKWMLYAIKLAKLAERKGEVPVGSVLVLNNKIIGKGWNSSIHLHDPTAHAEIIALSQGGKAIKNYRLLNTVLYSTLEPCIMCIGAIIHSRINRLVFGAKDKKNQKFYSLSKIKNFFNIKNDILLINNVLQKECASQLNNFFSKIRKKN